MINVGDKQFSTAKSQSCACFHPAGRRLFQKSSPQEQSLFRHHRTNCIPVKWNPRKHGRRGAPAGGRPRRSLPRPAGGRNLLPARGTDDPEAHGEGLRGLRP